MSRHSLKLMLVAALPLFLLTGCAELQMLRERTVVQEKTIKRLQQENAEFQKNYYKIKEMLDSENVKSQKSVEQLQHELESAKNLKTQQEKELSDKLHTLSLEHKALQSEAADQKKAADARIAQLDRDKQTLSAERDAALNKLKEVDEKLRAELANSANLTQQVASLKVESKTLADRVAGLEKDIATRDQALAAEKDARSKADKQVADLGQQIATQQDTLKKTQDEAAQIRQQLEEARAQAGKLEEVKKEKDALATQLDTIKSQHKQEVETLRAETSKAAKASLADDEELKALAAKVAPALKAGASTKVDRTGLRIIIPSAMLFDEKATILSDSASSVLDPLAATLKQVNGRTIKVIGHTDNQPVKDLPYADNYQLGFSRADRVREYLMKEGGLDQLETVSLAGKSPLASNDTPEGRKKNRRVEIVIGGKSE